MSDRPPVAPLVTAAGDVNYPLARTRIGAITRALAQGLDVAGKVTAALEPPDRLAAIAELDAWRRATLERFVIEPGAFPYYRAPRPPAPTRAK